MGVSTTQNRIAYQGDGTSTTFSFPYYFTKQTDLNVYVYDTVLGGVTAQNLNTDYTISGTANAQGIYTSGASVVMTTAPASTAYLVIVRNPAFTQTYTLLENGTISSTALVQQLDYLTLLCQRLESQVSRAVTIPDGVGVSFGTVLPSNLALQPGGALIVKADGSGVDIGPASWQTVTIPFSSIQFGGLSHSITAFQLPKQGILSGVAIKHTQAFSGGAISDITFDLGVSGDTNKFIAAFDGFQAVTDTAVAGDAPNMIGSFAGATNILLTSTAVGANLSALTQGSLNIYWQYFPL